MFDFTQITLVIGKYNKNTHAIDMLGTGFLISNEGKVVTARHVVGNETNDLCVLLPHIPNINVQSPNQKIPDRKTKCVIKTHINIKQNVIFGAKLKPV